MSKDDRGLEPMEVALVVFLAFVVVVALLTILSPQIETLVESVTRR